METTGIVGYVGVYNTTRGVALGPGFLNNIKGLLGLRGNVLFRKMTQKLSKVELVRDLGSVADIFRGPAAPCKAPLHSISHEL